MRQWKLWIVFHGERVELEGESRMESEERHDQARKPYEKPEVRRFPLRPEEAVLGFCKSSSMAGPGQSTCDLVGFCQTAGS